MVCSFGLGILRIPSYGTEWTFFWSLRDGTSRQRLSVLIYFLLWRKRLKKMAFIWMYFLMLASTYFNCYFFLEKSKIMLYQQMLKPTFPGNVGSENVNIMSSYSIPSPKPLTLGNLNKDHLVASTFIKRTLHSQLKSQFNYTSYRCRDSEV